MDRSFGRFPVFVAATVFGLLLFVLVGLGVTLLKSRALTVTSAEHGGGVWSERSTDYVVVAGDTLYDISKRLLGSGARWREILELNRDLVQRPEMLRVGIRLRIPDVQD